MAPNEGLSMIGKTLSHYRVVEKIGAGHCHYSIIMCRAHPGLHVTVVDLEMAKRVGYVHRLGNQVSMQHQ